MSKLDVFRTVSIVFASFIFSLMLAEATLAVFDLYPARPHPLRQARPDLFQADDKIGYRLWRSTETSDRYPVDRAVVLPIVSNSEGFRSSREFDELDSRLRVLVVGDSFVFGNGVREEERLTEVLEAMNPSWRVDNLGMTGWGIDLMLRGLENVGMAIRPDIIVLAVYTDDFRRVLPDYAGMGYPIPKYELEDGNLVTEPYPSATGWRRLRMVQLWNQIYWNRIKNRNRYNLNEALLNRFADIAQQNQSKLVVLFLPGKGDSHEDKQRRSFLRDWASNREIPYSDLTDALHGPGVDKTYITNNWHWAPLGHRIAATKLNELLASENLVPASPQ